MILNWDTIEVICCAYRVGALQNRTLKLGDVTVTLSTRRNFNVITVKLPRKEASLTLWDTYANHEDSIRTYFGGATRHE